MVQDRSTVSAAAAEAAELAAQEVVRRSLRKKVSICYGDLDVGPRLGEGGYCGVHEVKLQDQSRKFAMKRLLSEMIEDESEYISGARDLATEAVILSNMSHENIIHVQGMASGSMQDSFGSEEGFFLVMDRLETTLDKQIDSWWDEEDAMGWRQRRKVRTERLLERMDVALEIARGMRYVHSRNIVHRDLKPANIGFDDDGVVKLFDFGISAQLEDEQQRLTEKVGTPRFMAPEMTREEAYGMEVDMYAFGLILWQLCELDKPYMEWSSVRLLKQHVALEGSRPKLARWWPKAVKVLIQQCWAQDPAARPSFHVIVEKLEDIVNAKK